MTARGLPYTLDRLAEGVGELVERVDRVTADRRDLMRYAPGEGVSVEERVRLVVRFAGEVLGAELTDQQEQIVGLYVANRRAAVRSAVGIGKTFVAAVVVLYHVYVVRGMVVAVSATQRQVVELLFGELRRLWHQSGLPGELYQSALRVNEAAGQLAIGFATTDTSRLRGFHHPRLLVLCDESQGLESWTWESVALMATGTENKVLAIGNAAPAPTGPWYEMHRLGSGWATLRLSAREHPNIREGREVVPGGPSREWIASVPFAVRALVVDAETPDSDAGESLITRAMFEAAVEWWRAGTFEAAASQAEVIAALDVARFGPDSSSLAIRRGPVVNELVTWSQLSTMATLDRVEAELRARCLRAWEVQQFTIPPHPDTPLRLCRLTIDEAGLGGGVVDRARELGWWVHPFNGGHTPRYDQGRFLNRRAEAYWTLRTVLERGQLALPPDDRLVEELLATRWHLNPAGKVQLEAKEDIRARLGRSPDLADAIAMGCEMMAPSKGTWGVADATW